jgi:hypothetical protein
LPRKFIVPGVYSRDKNSRCRGAAPGMGTSLKGSNRICIDNIIFYAKIQTTFIPEKIQHL